MTVENLVAKDVSDALLILEPEISSVCNALSIMLADSNCNKQIFQPRVTPDWDRRCINEKKIVPQNQQSRFYIDKDGNQVYEIHAGIQVSVECFTKLYSKISTDKISEIMKPLTARYQYVMQEYCAALGTEGVRSKYFHLFCIIEFIEREYFELAGAEKLLNDEQIELLCKALKETIKSTDINKSVQSNVVSGVKDRMMGMTTIGRTQKPVNILHAMGVKNVKDGGVEFNIDKKHMQKHIDTRNTLFHGNDSDKDLRNLVTELMCIDIKVLEYLRNNCDIQK